MSASFPLLSDITHATIQYNTKEHSYLFKHLKSAIWARLGKQCRLGRAMPILGAVSGNPFRPQTTVMRLHFYILFSISGSATARDSQPGAE